VPEETLPISLCSDHPMLRRAGVAILAVLIAAAMVSGTTTAPKGIVSLVRGAQACTSSGRSVAR
jgi:hypothetical protein